MITQDSIALTKHEVTFSGCEYEMNGKEIYWTNLIFEDLRKTLKVVALLVALYHPGTKVIAHEQV